MRPPPPSPPVPCPPRKIAPITALVAALITGLALVGTSSMGCEPTRQPLHVFAASSLQDVVHELEASHEAAHPHVDVVPNFAGSQQLRLQIEQGARPAVFLSADRSHVDALHAAGLVEAPRRFACNGLVLVVPVDSTAVRDLRTLPRAERLVVGAPEVPAGRYTELLFDRAAARYKAGEHAGEHGGEVPDEGREVVGQDWRRAVERAVVSRELNVRQVLAKVALGEADAAVVYRSDAQAAAGSLRVIPLPPELDVEASYWMARVRDPGAGARAAGQSIGEWMATLESPATQKRLVAHGFRACKEAR